MVRKRNQTHSFSSSTNNAATRETRASSTSSGHEESVESSITSVPDMICSVDTFPKLSGTHGMASARVEGAPLSSTRAALRYGLGRLKQRFPLSAGASEQHSHRSRRRRKKHTASIRTVDTSSSSTRLPGRAGSKRRRAPRFARVPSVQHEYYRLPRGLRPSSMFHLKVQYANSGSSSSNKRKGKGISNSPTSNTNDGNNDESYKRNNNQQNRSIVIIAPPPDPPAAIDEGVNNAKESSSSPPATLRTPPSRGRGQQAVAAIASNASPPAVELAPHGQQNQAMHPFSFSPSLSSLLSTLTSADAHHNRQLLQAGFNLSSPPFAKAQMEAADHHQQQASVPHAINGLQRSNTRLVNDRLSLILACRYCAAVHHPGKPKTSVTSPCSQCLADPTMVIPRRANFVHTSAGPTLDIVGYFAAHYANASLLSQQQQQQQQPTGAQTSSIPKVSFDSMLDSSMENRSSNGSDGSLGSLGNMLASVVSSTTNSSLISQSARQALNGSGVWYDSDDAPADSLPGMRIRLRQRSLVVPPALPSPKEPENDADPGESDGVAFGANVEHEAEENSTRRGTTSSEDYGTDASQYHSACSAIDGGEEAEPIGAAAHVQSATADSAQNTTGTVYIFF
ncbi:hypothetical protein LPJ59_005079 [Coemansia sp. RSA 2399]|nr:hypothetical protein LPJ59_005079 [Coemansia sp. RSA 2399]